jgi:hypothetical protein
MDSDKGTAGGLDGAWAANCKGISGAAKINKRTEWRNGDCSKIGAPPDDNFEQTQK